MKKIKCPVCGNTEDFSDGADGLWSETPIRWSDEDECYYFGETNYDGGGARYVECCECGRELPYKLVEKLDGLTK